MSDRRIPIHVVRDLDEPAANGNDPRMDPSFEQRVEDALLQLLGRMHRLETDVALIRQAQVQQGLRSSLHPPRPPAPSGHWDDIDDDCKTNGGTRVYLTREQLDEHVRRVVGDVTEESQEHSELQTWRAVKGGLGAWAKGAIGAGISAGFIATLIAVWLWFRHFVATEIHGPGGPHP